MLIHSRQFRSMAYASVLMLWREEIANQTICSRPVADEPIDPVEPNIAIAGVCWRLLSTRRLFPSS
jgi:hypothetical protein